MSNPLSNPLLVSTADPFARDVPAKTNPFNFDPEDRPDEVVVGDDGRHYFSNPTFTPGFGWSTEPNYDEPAYYFTSSNELGDVNSERFEEDEFGNLVSVDAGFQREAGSWLSRGEIEQRWNADQGMGFFKQAHPDMSFDDYMNFLDEASMLQASGQERTSYMTADGEMVEGLNPAYLELYAKYDIKDRWTNSDGDEFRFNGGSFTKTSKVDDSFDAVGLLTAIAASALTAGVAAAVAPALAGAIGVSTTTAKGLISAAIGLAKDGEVSLEDALGIAVGDMGALGFADEMTDVTQEAIDSAIDAATSEILNPDNYGQTESGDIVWDQHDGKVISGVVDADGNYTFDPSTIQVVYPDYGPLPTEDEDNGGGGEDGGEGAVDPSEPGEEGTPSSPADGGADVGGGEVVDDKRWVYKDGVWTDGYEIIYGPGNEGDVMSDEEMNDAWESGDYTWEDPGAGVSDPDAPGDTDGETIVDIILPGADEEVVVDGPDSGEVVVDTPVGPGAPGTTPSERPVTRPDESGGVGSGNVGDGAGGSEGGSDGSQGDVDGTGSNGESDKGTSDGEVDDAEGRGWTIGTGVGPGSGPGDGPGDGPGKGTGEGGKGVGMLSGFDNYTPQWGELFEYTTVTPYQAEKLEPYKKYIKQARGMLS